MLLFRREQIEPRGDDSLHGLRNRQLFGVTALCVHLRVLLRIERVAPGLREQTLLRIRFEHRPTEQRAEEPRRLVVGER